MAVHHTNRKNVTYTLCKGTTKTGKPRYYFTREPKGNLVDRMPIGFKISESINGIVSLIKDKPSSILPEEISTIEKAIIRHHRSDYYRVWERQNRIYIYERIGLSPDDLITELRKSGIPPMANIDRIKEDQDVCSQFTPIVRFILEDEDSRVFRVERMCYLLHSEGWIDTDLSGKIKELIDIIIPKLGTDEFFDLY